MVTQLEALKYYLKMYDEGSIYVWGFNSGTIITPESIEKAYKNYRTADYNRTYYNNKLKEGLGKNGSDCSGAHYGISGYDTTAEGYYKKCVKKGKIDTMPTDKVVLLFKGKSSITHTGVYLPGYGAFHMASSKRNAVLEDVSIHNWTYWGYADFISDYDTYTFGEEEPEPYTQKQFIEEVISILGAKSVKDAFNKTITISEKYNRKNELVTPLERYMTELGYYKGAIEADAGKEPVFGEGMAAAIKKYQKEIVKASTRNQDGIITAKKATWKKLLGLS